MATEGERAEVRLNVDEPTDATFGDDLIDGLVDSVGVAAASAVIWRQKAAAYAKLVNVSEAGASHSFSDLHKNALEMAEQFEAQVSVAAGRTRVKVIDRE